jgi:hypothetical protein
LAPPKSFIWSIISAFLTGIYPYFSLSPFVFLIPSFAEDYFLPPTKSGFADLILSKGEIHGFVFTSGISFDCFILEWRVAELPEQLSLSGPCISSFEKSSRFCAFNSLSVSALVRGRLVCFWIEQTVG